MILLNFFIGFFAIFISPHIFIYYKFPNIKYSLVLISSFILSFTTVWIITLFSYYLNLPNFIFYYLAIVVMLSSLIFMYQHRNIKHDRKNLFVIWIISIILMMPLFQYIGTGFTEWDAVVSWNRWALNLYKNEYHPIDAAYPVLMPSLLSVMYKIQGTSSIWWTAKIALLVLPLVGLVLPLTLFNEYKNKTFLFIAIFLYPYLIMRVTIEGAVDMPVMIMGMLTLIVIYAAEINKKNKSFEFYAYSSLLLAGLASITKQSGLAFLVFGIIYVILNFNHFTNKKRLFLIILAMLLYPLSFLSIYELNKVAGVTGNLNDLISLSAYFFHHKELLWDKFFYRFPDNLPIFEPIVDLFKIKVIMPYLMGLGFIIFLLKGIKKYTSLEVLSIIFLIAGFFAWGKYASYHERNSYWVKDFLILFISINFSYFITWYQTKKFSSVVILFPLILLSALYFASISNKFADQKQQAFQKKIGWENMAKEIAQIVKKKDKCVQIYTNDYTLLYNYYTKDIQDRITSGGVDRNFLRQAIENRCKDGSYLTFRAATRTFPIWNKGIVKLIHDKKILPYKGNLYLYYVPPYTKLDADYFDDKTIFVKKKIENYDNDVIYHIDSIKGDNNSYLIKGWAFVKTKKINTKETYIVLKNNNHEYIVATSVVVRQDVAKFFKANNVIRSGFKSQIYKKNFDKGVYALYILLIEKNKKQHLIKTDKQIIINYNTEEKGSS